MYLITAVINSECLTNLLEDLSSYGIEGVTISDARGKGRLANIETKDIHSMDTHVRLDIVVSNDTFKELAKEAIRANARELEKGSGKMWVTPVLEVERIRTGETNDDALAHVLEETLYIHAEENYTHEDTPSS